MRCLLLLCFLLVSALGGNVDRPTRDTRNEVVQSSLGSYLPPSKEPCYPSVVYYTTTSHSQVIVPTTVYSTEVRYKTTTHYRNQVYPSTYYSQLVSTQYVPKVHYVSQSLYTTLYNTRTQYVTLPPAVDYVTVTKTQDQVQVQHKPKYTTRYQKVPTTIYRNVVSTKVVPQQVVSTVYKTNVVTSTVQLRPYTQVVTSKAYSTYYSTRVIPPQMVYVTQTAYKTNYVTTTVYLPPEVQIVTSTLVQKVYSTVYSEVVKTTVQTQYVTRTKDQQVVSTYYHTQRVPQYVTRTQVIPQQVVRTQYKTTVVPTTIYRKQVVPTYVNLPAKIQHVTTTRMAYETETLFGQASTKYSTNVVYHTNYVTSTVYNKKYNTVYATQTVQESCKTGYNYDEPEIPFPLG